MIDRARDVAEQAVRLVAMGMASLCLHGDSEGATARADAIREALARSGIRVAPFLDPAHGGA